MKEGDIVRVLEKGLWFGHIGILKWVIGNRRKHRAVYITHSPDWGPMEISESRQWPAFRIDEIALVPPLEQLAMEAE